jgi:membrane protease YdiL (CAAX protease family)
MQQTPAAESPGRGGISDRAAAIGLLLPVLLMAGATAATTTDGSAGPIALTNAELLGGLLIELLLTATIGVWLWRSGWRPHRDATRPFESQDLMRGLGLWVGAILSVVCWALVCRLLWPGLLTISEQTQIIGTPHLLVSVVFSIYNALFEELLWLALGIAAFRRFGLATAATVSVALRLLAHSYQGPLALITILPIGIVFTIYYLRSRRLWPIVVAHAFQDILALTMLANTAARSAG